MAKTFGVNPWQVGDEITAQRLNETGDFASHPDFTELESNVIDLILQAYFDGKSIPYQGLFFDGFSDSSKVGALNDLTVDTANKRLLLPTASASAFVLVVGGGAGGAASRSANSNPVAGGGGGGGQVLDLTNFTLNPGSFNVVIGLGGSGGLAASGSGGNNGGNTTFGSLIANGGGGGAPGGNSGPGGPGGASGNGNAGGPGGGGFNDGGGFKYGGGGGGGNGAVGEAGTRGDFGGSGGAGTLSSISGSSVEYGHGGKGGGGGPGVGGSGQYGDGGGGAQGSGGVNQSGGPGTQGVVIIKYPIGAITATGGSISTAGGYTIHTFTSDGIFTVTEVNDGTYESVLSRFQQAKRSVRLWVTRNLAVRYNLKNSISQGATQLTFKTDLTGEVGIGDTIDISDANNIVRERKSITNVSSTGNPVVAFDAANAGSTGVTGDNKFFSIGITVANQPNRLLVIFAGARGTQRTVHNVQVNGINAVASGFNTGTGNRNFQLWYFTNPPVGSNTVTIEYSTTNSAAIHALSFYNASQASNPFRQGLTASGSFGGSGTINTLSPTSSANDMAVSLIGGDVGEPTAGAGQTERSDTGEETSTKAGNLPTVSMTWTGTSSGDFHHTAASIKPAQNEVTVDFSPGVSNAGGFSTTGFFERVEVQPQVSLVVLGGANNFQSMTYIKSTWDSANNEVEDEYTFTTGTDSYDFKAKLAISHIASTGIAYAKRLGCALQNQ